MKIQNTEKYTNKSFNKLKKAEKRVAIAQDVLDQIKNKIIRPENGSWISWGGKNIDSFEEKDGGTSLKKEILENGLKQSCDCCALGSLMLSCTLFNNEVTLEDVLIRDAFDYMSKTSGSDIKTGGLESVFSDKQIEMIEMAFEKGGGLFKYNDNPDWEEYNNTSLKGCVAGKCVEFGEKYKSSKGRLVAIMNNIIENKGEFIP